MKLWQELTDISYKIYVPPLLLSGGIVNILVMLISILYVEEFVFVLLTGLNAFLGITIGVYIATNMRRIKKNINGKN